MVKLRLRRVGRKNLPVYKIVAADSRAPRDGRFIESVGTYNPGVNPPHIELSEERIYHWLRSGATPTETVRSLLSKNGTLLKLNLMKRGFDDERIKEEFEKWAAARAAKSERGQAASHRKKKKVSDEPAEALPAQSDGTSLAAESQPLQQTMEPAESPKQEDESEQKTV